MRRKLTVCLGFGGRIGGAKCFNGEGREGEFEF
jgi:hypothetical protein